MSRFMTYIVSKSKAVSEEIPGNHSRGDFSPNQKIRSLLVSQSGKTFSSALTSIWDIFFLPPKGVPITHLIMYLWKGAGALGSFAANEAIANPSFDIINFSWRYLLFWQMEPVISRYHRGLISMFYGWFCIPPQSVWSLCRDFVWSKQCILR